MDPFTELPLSVLCSTIFIFRQIDRAKFAVRGPSSLLQKTGRVTFELLFFLGCEYNGRRYRVGEGFPSSDGCNTCTCGSSGRVGCTEMACISR